MGDDNFPPIYCPYCGWYPLKAEDEKCESCKLSVKTLVGYFGGFAVEALYKPMDDREQGLSALDAIRDKMAGAFGPKGLRWEVRKEFHQCPETGETFEYALYTFTPWSGEAIKKALTEAARNEEIGIRMPTDFNPTRNALHFNEDGVEKLVRMIKSASEGP